MDKKHGTAASLRPNSAHFHHLFSSQKPSTVTSTTEDFNEDDIFFSASADSEPPSPAKAATEPTLTLHRKSTFQLSSGVLAALPDSSSDTHRLPKTLLQRKPSLPITKPIPAIPRPPSERDVPTPVSQSAPARKFQHSAPMRVPMLARRKSRVVVDDIDDDECDGEERLPPHEIVARRFGGSVATSSFSVLEGVGRTLKGRDLRQVRNAVWQQTGFLD